jgi:hypothetical protein
MRFRRRKVGHLFNRLENTHPHLNSVVISAIASQLAP